MGMDLNLYLGLHRSPRSSNLAVLGFDLALGSIPLPSSSTTGESPELLSMPGAAEPSDSLSRYSQPHASYNPDFPPIVPLHPAVVDPSSEYAPYCPYEPDGPSDPLVPPVVQGPEAPGAPYSPSDVQAFPVDEPRVQERDLQVSYDLASPLEMPERAAAGGREVEALYSTPYAPLSPSPPPGHDEVGFRLYRSVPIQVGEFLAQDDGSDTQQELLGLPEFRIRSLRHRRFRSSLSHDSEISNLGRPSSPGSERLLHDIMSSQRGLEMTGNHIVPAKHIVVEGSDEETEDKNRIYANFECNICFDMAKSPVVTSCGHLFCWPCLYQWLHLHCDHRECPVCKGEVIEHNITPIYGRGSSGISDEKKLGENEDSGLKIPPRPRGNRFESFRQQFRTISRGLPPPIFGRRFVEQQIQMRNRFEGHEDPSLQGIYDGVDRTPLTRMRARRRQREEGSTERGPNAGEIGLPRDQTSIPQVSNSSLYGIAISERVAATSDDIGRVVRRGTTSSSRYAASTSSVNPPDPEQLISRPPAPGTLAAEQASASSTMAVIQGDGAVTDASAEPNSAGSSRPHRRRGRSSISAPLAVYEGAPHARTRRRLN